MSLKDLFKKQGKKFLKPTSNNDLSNDVESADLVEAYTVDKETFIPAVDFDDPDNFARYGSAEKYYTDAFTRITDQYPYDGSNKEKTQWYISSSYIDKHIFDNIYPRTNGYINFFPNGLTSYSVGSTLGWFDPVASDTKIFRAPESKEYILIKGGPNADPNDDVKTPSSLANLYDLDKNRGNNLRLNAASGSTVEFWLKVDGYPAVGDAGGSDRMTLFDVWNGLTASNASYGRFEIYINNDGTGSNPAFGLHVISGSTGADAGVDDDFKGFNSYSSSAGEGVFSSYTKDTLADASWHHYAFVVKNSGSSLMAEMYVDGEIKQTLTKASHAIGEIKGELQATIGASNTWPEYIKDPGVLSNSNSYSVGRGANAFSGSMDEFRFWKDARTAKEIGRYWFTQVHGGTNTDDSNVDLGVYYKFNEGITNTASVDATVLDYSGRASNGIWTVASTTGMVGSQYRSTGSAIVLAGAALKENKDPIMYAYHTSVKDKRNDLQSSGSVHDDTNSSMLYNSFPQWIIEEDSEGELKDLSQILSSYFDTLHLQIEALPRLKDVTYQTGSHKPYFFNQNILNNAGFDTSELFYDEDFLENFDDRDDARLFREKLHNIKNTIYGNIYNNLVYINKSKGTEKSFRNLIRCFGIDEEFIRLNMYADGGTYTLEDSYRETAKTRNLVNFDSGSNTGGNRAASVYQYTDPNNSNSTSYVYGSKDDAGNEVYTPITTEAEIYFPKRPSESSIYYNPYQEVSSSLFGCYSAKEDSTDYQTESGDVGGFQVYSVRKDTSGDSTDCYFYLTGSKVPGLESDFFEDVYDNEKWNFAVRFRHAKEPFVNEVTGTFNSGSVNDIVVEFHGINTEAGVIKRQFTVSGTFDPDTHNTWGSAGRDTFFTERRRFYIGAHRLNAVGTLQTSTDVKFSYLRHWLSNVDNEEIKSHALSINNFGVKSPLRNTSIFDFNRGSEVPKIETLALNWNFSNVTGSDDSGEFLVIDESSGSAADTTRYGWLSEITKKQHTGLGINFGANKSNSILSTYIPTLRQTNPENLLSSETIKILDFDDEVFTRESRPINYFYALEKSPYQNISDEMLNMFATIKDFNNLIGEPINRYRQDYKDIGKLRNLFFEKIGNTPSVEKYINFYKWLDSSVTEMLTSLIPASANFSRDIKTTVIESHALERNKYWSKPPTLERKPKSDPEGTLKGIKELTYNWKTGHAPLTQDERDNCLWWKDRAERHVEVFDTHEFLSSSNEDVNLAKKDLLQAIVTSTTASNPKLATVAGTTYQGSDYAIRKLSRVTSLSANPVMVNATTGKNKKRTLWKTELKHGSAVLLNIPSSSLAKVSTHGCQDLTTGDDDMRAGQNKQKYAFKVFNSEKLDTGYLEGPGELLVPFSLYSSSVQQGYSSLLSTFSDHVQVTNLHSDWHTGEEPMQGPFTEKYVGGHQYRHADLNNAIGRNLDKAYDAPNRPEGFIIQIFTNSIFIRHASLDIDDQSYNPDNPTAKYYRDEVAKRPVNIRNIRQGTGSVPGGVTVIGNYEKNYQVVHTSGRNVNNLWLRTDNENDRTPQLTPEVWTLWGNVPDTGEGAGASTRQYRNALDFTLPDRDGKDNKTVIAERFSAPGGREVSARGFLDPGTETFSVYNSMNYRNSTVRTTYKNSQVAHAAQFGLLSGTIPNTQVEHHDYDSTLINDNSYAVDGAAHKVNRNSRYRYKERGNLDIELADGIPSGSWDIVPVHDNAYVQHVIPQNERQYAWITASLNNRSEPVESSPNNLVITPDGLTYDSKTSTWSNPFTWVTSSDFGVYTRPGFAVLGTPFSNQAGVAAFGFIPGDFAGLNTIVVDNLDASDNSIGSDALLSANNRISSSVNHGFVTTISGKNQPNWDPALAAASGDSEDAAPETIFNLLMLNRNGPGGWSSWKQTRLSRHPLARNMRKNNRLSILDPANPKKYTQSNAGAWHPMFNLLGIEPITKLAVVGTAERQTISFTEPAVCFNNKPLIHRYLIPGQKNIIVGSSHQNILETFSRPSIRTKTNIFNDTQLTAYNAALDIYDNLTDDSTIERLDYMTYTQTTFPRNMNTGLGKTRMRQNYEETAGSSTEGTGRDHHFRNTFWHDLKSGRAITRDSRNMFNVLDNGQGRNDLSGTQLSAWPMAPIESSELDDGYERYNHFGEMYPSGTYESIYTTSSISFMRSIASRATGSDNDFPTAADSIVLSTLVENGGIPVRMKKYNAHKNRKVISGYLGAGPVYSVSPRNPWYNSYEEYSQDIKLIGQGYSIIPEFKISDHIDYYVNSAGNFQLTNNKILSLKGAQTTSSAEDEKSTKIDNEFWTTYSSTDFMRYFDVIKDDHSEQKYRTSKITMKCSGVKKLLPYNGFYPMTRTVQLASILSQSLGEGLIHLNGSSHTGSWNTTGSATSCLPIIARPGVINQEPYMAQRFNSLLQPIMAPGVLFNSIKAGIAVDYPIHTGNLSPTIESGVGTSGSFAYEALTDRPNYRMPFEALVNFKNYVPQISPAEEMGAISENSKINFVEPNFINSTNEYIDHNAPGGDSREDAGPKIFCQWDGEIKPQFEMAMNNFLGETVRFFLKDQNLKSFTSKQEKEHAAMAVGYTYYMDIVLRKTDKFVLSEGSLEDWDGIHARNEAIGTANGVSSRSYETRLGRLYNDQRGYIYGPGYKNLCHYGSATSSNLAFASAFGTAYAPHAPPYLYGESIARVAFTPPDDESDFARQYTVKEVIDNATITYFNTHPDLNTPDLYARAAHEGDGLVTSEVDSAPAVLDQMAVSSSVVLNAIVRDPITAFDPEGNPMSISQQVQSSDTDRWVIYPKWECPALNVSSSNSGTIRSIWNDYGRIPEDKEGIYMEVRESYPELVNSPTSLTRSLVQVMGFDVENKSSKRIGELAEEKEISEAIVAIPYFEESWPKKGQESNSAIKTINHFANKHFIKIDKDVFDLTKENLRTTGGKIAIKAGDNPLNFMTGVNSEGVKAPGSDLVPAFPIFETSISDMIKKMDKYVLPPKFNFLRETKGAKPHPFVMYIFEFTHKLDQQDLCDIWNNLMPDIAVTAEKQESTISHDIGPYEFFGGRPNQKTEGVQGYSEILSSLSPFNLSEDHPDLRWMVFKVKQKAESSYYNITKTTEDDTDFKFDFGSKAGAKTPDYTYNWPYDFFSLVELAKLDTSITIKDREGDA